MKKRFYNKKWFKVLIVTISLSILFAIISYYTFDILGPYKQMKNTVIFGYNIKSAYLITSIQFLMFTFISTIFSFIYIPKYSFESKLNLVPYIGKEIIFEPEKKKDGELIWKQPDDWLDKLFFEETDLKKKLVVLRSEKYNKKYYMSFDDMKNIMSYIKNGRLIGYFNANYYDKYTTIKMVRPYAKKKLKHE